MDGFLRECGLSEAYGTTYVLVPEPQSTHIIAYFTISPDTELVLEDDEVLEDETFVLRRLAVDKRYRGQGIGPDLLAYIIEKVVEAADRRTVRRMILHPLNAHRRAYFLGLPLGLVELDANTLELHIDTMREAVRRTKAQRRDL